MPHNPRSLEIRNRLELQKLESRQARRAAKLSRSASLPVDEREGGGEGEGEGGSVMAPTDRPATGLGKGRRSVLLTEQEERRESGELGFISQFPYKSCQRSLTGRKVTGHKWPHNKSPENVPQRRVSLKRKAYTGKLEDPSFSHIPSASRPSSPDSQLEGLRRRAGERGEMNGREAEIYQKYILEELKEENIETMKKDLLDKIKYHLLLPTGSE